MIVATVAAEGITMDCNDIVGCRGGNSDWVVLAIKEEDGSRGRIRGDWNIRQHRNNGERIVVAGSCDCDKGLRMVASVEEGWRRGRGGNNGGDASGATRSHGYGSYSEH
ncbi:hypothetical protein BHM03_00035746 [Ensete ventricosum]|nr:hypothetical protein BHM03_00035746 [Ensete ventricosum]